MADNETTCQCAYVLADPYFGSIAIISIDNGLIIGEGGNNSPPIDIAKANAHLIAAAPELYESLHWVIEKTHENSMRAIFGDGVFEAAKRALLKARGET